MSSVYFIFSSSQSWSLILSLSTININMGCVRSSQVAPSIPPKTNNEREVLVINFRNNHQQHSRAVAHGVQQNLKQEEVQRQEQQIRNSGKPGWSKPQFLPLGQQKNQLQNSPVHIIFSSDKDCLPNLQQFTSLQSLPPQPPKKALMQIKEVEQQQMTSLQLRRKESEAKEERINKLIKIGVNDIVVEEYGEGEVCQQQILFPFNFLLPKVQMLSTTPHSL